MCGIVGHVVADDGVANSSAVSEALARLRHRGPDGARTLELGQASLGHARLSIIDIEGSIQPWQDESARFTLVFNGEIYNYLELRTQLEREGCIFRSHGDTEVLMHMYVKYRERCLTQLNGMFAFAVWDRLERSLFLARDRLGKKPVYYAAIDRDLVFSSEIPAILKFPNLDHDLDMAAVRDYFAYQFIDAPRTIYKGIRKLPAAHYLVYKAGKTSLHCYWRAPLPALDVCGLEKTPSVAADLRNLLEDSVRIRLRSDVPLGAFLSGGIDSAIIVGLMAKSGVSANTFTVGFDDNTYDESEKSAETAKLFHTNHHQTSIDMESMLNMDSYIQAFGEPFADVSAVPTWHMCEYARQHVTVALSGDGGDEVFGGYRRYHARRIVAVLLRLPAVLRKRVLYRLAEWLPVTDSYYASSIAKQVAMVAHMTKRFDETPTDLLPQIFTLSERNGLLTDRVPDGSADHIHALGVQDVDAVTQMLLADIHSYLCEDILTKVDRMSMAHSLEIRSPLLDYRVVEFACRLPLAFKIRGGIQKYILREAFRDMLPASVLERKKHGFAVPISRWLRGMLRPMFESVLEDSIFPYFLNKNEIRRLWTEHLRGKMDHGMQLWTIFVFLYWYRSVER